MIDWSRVFHDSLPYEVFLERHASPAARMRWDSIRDRVQFEPAQRSLLESFGRRMPLVCLAAGWCGDCAQQCPIVAAIARATRNVDLRFLEQNAHPAVRDALSINGGKRLPVFVFLSEDWYEVSRYGDRTLSIYRRMAADQLGSGCPTGLVPPSEEWIRTVTQEWLDEIERVHILLRLSTRLREKHGD